MIEIRCRVEGTALVVVLVGDVCLVSAPAIVSCLDAALDTATQDVIVDLTEVSVFGATGARVLSDARRRAAATGRHLHVRNPSALVAYVLDLCGLGDLVEPSLFSGAPAAR